MCLRFGFREFILGGGCRGQIGLTSPCWPQELGGGGGSTTQGTSEVKICKLGHFDAFPHLWVVGRVVGTWVVPWVAPVVPVRYLCALKSHPISQGEGHTP